MVTRKFSELVRDLKQRREVGDPPPVVLLGAGASVESGVGAMTDLFAFVNCADFEAFCAYINPLTPPERYRLLARFLQSRKPAEPTAGYRALAALCAEAYFDLLLTTNLDPLLDDALAHAQLWRRDYLLLVNGVIRPERLDLVLTAASPRVKVVKLHGDLFHRFMAWTPAEMRRLLDDIQPQIRPALHGRDALVVGHSLRDERIRALVLGAGGAIWYLNPKSAPEFLADNDRVRVVLGPDCAFEKAFTRLAEELGAPLAPAPAPEARWGETKAAAAASGARTLDDFMGSVVSILGPDSKPSFTGFVLAQPRVIVTDGYASATLPLGEAATLQTADGHRFRARVRRRERLHPFSPWLLEVPPDLRVPGLRLDATPPGRRLEVRVGVAAGERVGVSSGTIDNPAERVIDVAPVGQVSGLVEVQCVVAPGACGAPVVDATMAVRGFIVAGAEDRPPSIMYPASRWAGVLVRGRASGTSRAQGRKPGALQARLVKRPPP